MRVSGVPYRTDVDGYRRDVDGLRGVAVLAVVAYHVNERLVPGGFSGVDVFFVISGFLISGIAYRGLESGSWRLSTFYQRRIRRLFPALIVVLSAVYLFGWFALFADEYAQLGKHMAAASAFVANVVYYQEAGYFDTARLLKPLLHLWSLAVEEQFYLIWPALLVVVWVRGYSVLAVCLLICLGSFLFDVCRVSEHPVATFFLPVPRMWELLSGGALAYVDFRFPGPPAKLLTRALLGGGGQRKFGQYAADCHAVAGLLLVLGGLFAIDSDKSFPGWWALLPVSGTLLAISAGDGAWINRRILGSRLLVFVGLISYPLYLWHWPLLSYARIVESGNPATWLLCTAVAASFALAWMTYQFVEIPFRFGKSRPGLKTMLLVWVMVLIGCGGYTTYSQGGFPFRRAADSDVKSLTAWKSAEGLWRRGCPISEEHLHAYIFCLSDTRAAPTSVLIGDSRAYAIFPGLVSLSKPGESWSVVSWPGLAPFRGLAWKPNENLRTDLFPAFRDAIIARIDSDRSISLVLIAQASRVLQDRAFYEVPKEATSFEDWMYEALSSTIAEFERGGKRVAFLVDNPEITLAPEACVRKRPFQSLASRKAVCSLSRARYEESIRTYRKLVRRLSENDPGLLIYDPTDLLCDKHACSVTKDGKALYFSTDHYSDFGSQVVAKGLLTSLRDAGAMGIEMKRAGK
jgi:peptidoglycan/LPS O-acetylase OafA/YrhL